MLAVWRRNAQEFVRTVTVKNVANDVFILAHKTAICVDALLARECRRNFLKQGQETLPEPAHRTGTSDMRASTTTLQRGTRRTSWRLARRTERPQPRAGDPVRPSEAYAVELYSRLLAPSGERTSKRGCARVVTTHIQCVDALTRVRRLAGVATEASQALAKVWRRSDLARARTRYQHFLYDVDAD